MFIISRMKKLNYSYLLSIKLNYSYQSSIKLNYSDT